jgi:hypothetical protein
MEVSMNISGLHLLLSYQCTFECDHCFVWGSPFQSGTMTLGQVRRILQEAKEAGTVTSIYFEGGEPFLFYPVMLRGAIEAREMGFSVGIVSNAYWAEDVESALEWLRPFAGWLGDLSVSSDLFHYSEKMSRQAHNATAAAAELGIPMGTICIARPEEQTQVGQGQIPEGESGVMYRGRAVEKLAGGVPHHPWTKFTTCPHEDLREPGRVHVDAYGNMHICQGIVIGNLFREPLKEIAARYNPDGHYIVGPLLVGGPAQLARTYGLEHEPAYADACHLCYSMRKALRSRFPHILTPDQMYGVD